MGLTVNDLICATYLVPIAITLRKIYAPSFETPEAIAIAVAKVDAQRRMPMRAPHGASSAQSMVAS